MTPLGEQFIKRINDIIEKYCRAAVEQIKMQWQKSDLSGHSFVDYHVEDVKNIIKAEVFAQGQKAWILEYGKGSKMERDTDINPFLKPYMNGRIIAPNGEPVFNKARLKKNLAILGRPKGDYFDLEGRVHHSNGTREGVDLEEIEPSMGGMTPLPPKHIIRKVLIGDNNDGIIADINAEIQEAVGDFVLSMMKELPSKFVIMKE